LNRFKPGARLREGGGFVVARKKKVLLVGETWVSSANHFKGFDSFTSTTFHSGAQPLLDALADSPFELRHMPSHEAVESFPFDLEGLAGYDAIMLSDIGANSLLLPAAVWLHGQAVPNRLRLIEQWTTRGGGLLMAGGYLSFQGIDGRARWSRTQVEHALPVECLHHDDRVEVPEGFSADILKPDHPIVSGLRGPWPALLGVNEVRPKQRADVEVLARVPPNQGGHPLLVTGRHGRGRTVAWTSDIGPHWLPAGFSEWPGYSILWRNVLEWVTRRE
jgi:uncharacterized membrane protein